ncbi:helix-turn-helix transcriptional regulator [Pseudomonas gingeri]|uniref:Helix-turn-helix transcriptional regulator n=1 Tax=Pseudomonas gingeri TaxID=117681 RepID=A0A7Y8BRM3_9PSED|nr:helix-turn-helix transcriptional regulator [Pseudomonas gingeri]
MNVPEMLGADVVRRVSCRVVDIADSRGRNKQDFIQSSKAPSHVVVLPALDKPRRCRLSKSKTLSEKELEVLRWARAGKTVWEISVIRDVSEATVKFHLRNIYHKLGVSNRAHAVGEAVNRGLV